MEEWKDVKGYEGLYKCSSYGNIKGLVHKKILKTYKLFGSKNYYRLQVMLSKKGKNHTMFVHKIIALSFIDNPHNYKQINHIDHNTSNNNIENLEWCTSKHNINHKKRRNIE